MVLTLGKTVARPCGRPGFDSQAGGWATKAVALPENVG